MTETRKQIIEIIEPFMDKTLSFWCIVYSKISSRYHTLLNEKNFVLDVAYFTEKLELNWQEEILWHYDITAVFRYLKSNDKLSSDIIIYKNSIWIHRYWYEALCIPNKPLHLYTEEQDKNLLELLQKLWQKN